jgi:hypothetical protein
MTGRKTKLIKYNIKDRGRLHNGQDRSNVNFDSMINKINSPQVQELVASGDLYGYYGHDIRKRFGLNPPETAIVAGQKILLEPAIRTVSLKAYKNGDVEHIQEFLNNDSGEFARCQYVAKIGGFSSAQRYDPSSSPLAVSSFHGFDLVRNPNYATNVGDGVLFDGLLLDDAGIPSFDDMSALPPDQSERFMMLDSLIAQSYQSIHTQMHLQRELGSTSDAMATLLIQQQAQMDKQARYAAIRERKNQERIDLAFSSRSFDDIQVDANAFLSHGPKTSKEIDSTNEQSLIDAAKKPMWTFDWLMGSKG